MARRKDEELDSTPYEGDRPGAHPVDVLLDLPIDGEQTSEKQLMSDAELDPREVEGDRFDVGNDDLGMAPDLEEDPDAPDLQPDHVERFAETEPSRRTRTRTMMTLGSPRGPRLLRGTTSWSRLTSRVTCPEAAAPGRMFQNDDGAHRTRLRAARPIASLRSRRPPRSYFAGAGSAAAGGASFEDFFAFLAFFALFGASVLAASSANAANEVARTSAAISFFM
jgi:hypothetical protein